MNHDVAIAIEGACDFFFGRPFDANPYARVHVPEAWALWRNGWLYAAEFAALRGDSERRRWLLESPA